MTSDIITLVRAEHRCVRLKRRRVQPVFGEPPLDLALTVEIELADDTTSRVLSSARLQTLLHWLRGGMREKEYVKHLIGQEPQLAVIVCWLNGLVPAVDSERDIAAAIFGIGDLDLTPRITGSELCCVGYTLSGLWYTDTQTVAKMLCVNLIEGTISVVSTWFPKPE